MITPGVETIQTILGQATWQTWVPTYTAFSGTFTLVTTNSARYLVRGGEVEFFIDFTVNNAGTAAVDCRFTLPITALQHECFSGQNVSSGAMLHGRVAGAIALCWIHDQTFPAPTGARLSFRGQYRTA